MIVTEELIAVPALVISAGFPVCYVHMSLLLHERIESFGTEVASESASLVYPHVAA